MSLAEQLAKRAGELKPVGEAPPKQKTMAEMLQERAAQLQPAGSMQVK